MKDSAIAAMSTTLEVLAGFAGVSRIWRSLGVMKRIALTLVAVIIFRTSLVGSLSGTEGPCQSDSQRAEAAPPQVFAKVQT